MPSFSFFRVCAGIPYPVSSGDVVFSFSRVWCCFFLLFLRRVEYFARLWVVFFFSFSRVCDPHFYSPFVGVLLFPSRIAWCCLLPLPWVVLPFPSVFSCQKVTNLNHTPLQNLGYVNVKWWWPLLSFFRVGVTSPLHRVGAVFSLSTVGGGAFLLLL